MWHFSDIGCTGRTEAPAQCPGTTLIFSLILHIQTFDGAFNAPLRRVISLKGVGAATKRIDLVTDDLALAAAGSDGIGCRAEVRWIDLVHGGPLSD